MVKVPYNKELNIYSVNMIKAILIHNECEVK